MSDDESNIDDRGRDLLNTDQQNERVGDDRGDIEENQRPQEPDNVAPKETVKNDQSVRNDKIERRDRGRENWGGYQGY